MKVPVLLSTIALSFFLTGTVSAQNKTLGVGATTPNPNAALHVESPTSNQGFIMPRLTTAQRTAMSGILGAADNGLMLYDTDLKGIYIWDGSAWKSPAEVSGTVNTSNGTDTVAVFRIDNPASFAAAVYAETNGDSLSAAVRGNNIGHGFGVYGTSYGSKFGSAAVYGQHFGTGDAAGVFRISNPSSTYSGLYGETNGTGPAIFGAQIGLGRGGQFQITNAANGEAALRSFTSGTGRAGFFTLANDTSSAEALFSTTNGSGVAIYGESTGTGSAGKFVNNNVNSMNPALWAETNSDQPLSAPIFGLNTGTGDVAASFKISNPANTFPGLFVETAGTGRAATFRKTSTTGGQPGIYVETAGGHGIWADHSGATGFAGIIQTINTANTNAALLVESIGSGPSVWALKSIDAVSGDAFVAENVLPTGSAGRFTLSDATNTESAIITNTSGTGAAILAENNGAGNGFAGLFSVTNASNTFPAIQATTAGSGPGLAVFQDAGTGSGVAVHIQNATSPAPGISVDQQGIGNGIWVGATNTSNTAALIHSTQAGGGSAGHFEVTNATSAATALHVQTAGTGSAFQAVTSTGFTSIYGRREGATNGNAGLFEIIDAGNTYPSLQSNTAGTGSAGNFIINNGSSTAPAVWAQTSGVGAAFAGDNTSTGDVIFVEKTGAAGSAGNFRINNASSTNAAVFVTTNSASGDAVTTENTANGRALTIANGGMRLSVAGLTGGGSITQRAAAYHIDANVYTFDSGAVPFSEGDVFYFFNTDVQSATVNGITIPAATGKTLIYLGGALREF